MKTTVADITYEHIVGIKDKLKNLDTEWVKKVAIRMLAKEGFDEATVLAVANEAESDNPLVKQVSKKITEVRNISINSIRHNGRRRDFLICANEVLEELIKAQSEALKIGKKHSA